MKLAMNQTLAATKCMAGRNGLRSPALPRPLALAVTVGLCAAALLLLPIARGRADDRVEFSRDIRPILSENCFFCHGPDAEARTADLRLDQEAAARTVIEAGDPAASELFRRVTSDDEFEQMPPPEANRRLTSEQVALLARWIEQGASWGTHWAYAPLERPELPALLERSSEQTRPAHPIDRFVQARLAQEGLDPAPLAEPRTLIRRVTLDLTGLPPTPDEVTAFLADAGIAADGGIATYGGDESRTAARGDRFEQAYARLVDRLLASPAFGERLAWDWLDAARYADSNGYQGDQERTMWPWRDWVVQAFNENMPFDQFTVWQLAGDLLPNATFEQRLATGFCRNHMINGEGGRIPEENRVDYVMDMSETAGTVWLAMTLNCCRCHDHKFDPLTQRDYYSMTAFFNQTPVDGGGGNPQTPPVLAAPTTRQREALAAIDQQLASLDEQLQVLAGSEQAGENDTQRTALNDRRQQLEAERKQVQDAVPQVMVMQDRDEPRTTYVLDRGLYNKPGETVAAAVPASLPPLPDQAPRDRLGLARWLVSDTNPLTARVVVNRFWQQFFGIGLVKTAEDFGVQGEIPAYRDMLNWLAAEFRDGGWDVKRLLRTIVTSRTYRHSSRIEAPGDGGITLAELDPENRLLARGPRYRLPSWMLRDQALAAAGLLSQRIGGPPVNVYQPPGVWEEATFGKKQYQQDHGESLYRRSLYIFWRRIVGPTVFFDNASRQTCTVKVFRTNTPLHALLTLNDVTYVESARVLAEQTLLQSGTADDQRLNFVFQRLLARNASAAEREILLAGLNRTRDEFADSPDAAMRLISIGEWTRSGQLAPVEHAAWTAVCLAVMNLDETLNKE